MSLLKPHYSDAVNYCRALCSGKSKLQAEDIFQESMLKAFEKRDSLQDTSKFRSWLFQIITNNFLNSQRPSFKDRFSLFDTNNEKNGYLAMEDDFFMSNQLLIAALSMISDKERSALLLFEIGGFSIKEITDLQGENSESAVKSRLSRTRCKLREIIEELEDDHSSSGKTLSITLNTKTDLNNETYKIIKQTNIRG